MVILKDEKLLEKFEVRFISVFLGKRVIVIRVVFFVGFEIEVFYVFFVRRSCLRENIMVFMVFFFGLLFIFFNIVIWFCFFFFKLECI